MAAGETKYITDSNGQLTGRISITVDHVAHVFDVPQNMTAEDAIAAFWAQRAKFKAYERRIIASNDAKRRAEAAEARKAAIEGMSAMSDDQVAEIVDKQKPVKLTFEGLEIDEELVAASEKKPVVAVKEVKTTAATVSKKPEAGVAAAA